MLKKPTPITKPILSNPMTFIAGTGKKVGIKPEEKKLDKGVIALKKRMGAK